MPVKWHSDTISGAHSRYIVRLARPTLTHEDRNMKIHNSNFHTHFLANS